jgi:dipeptidyl aminopeptidase/acylaminoacyl peptidase
MFDFFVPDHPFGGQTLRLVAEAQWGGGDVFDIARCTRRIELGNKDSWEKEWIALAEMTEGRARQALADGHNRTAMQYFFHANNYWRMADVFLQGFDPRRAKYFSKAQENFRAAARLHSPKMEIIQVKRGDQVYDGYFCHPANPKPGKWPAVFMIGGADSFAEEIFFSGRQIVDRGMALLLVDTPGRGSSLYLKKIPTRPDYEVPSMACVDWLVARPEVDANRVAVLGISLAGYYAPRLAAFDRRIKALVGWSGCYSMLHDVYEFCEHLQPTLRRLLGDVDEATAKKQLAAFTMADCAKNIACPTLISHGTEDRLMSVEGAKKLFEAVGAKDKTLKLYDGKDGKGGAIHCSHDRWVDNVPFMLDWLEARL